MEEKFRFPSRIETFDRIEESKARPNLANSYRLSSSRLFFPFARATRHIFSRLLRGDGGVGNYARKLPTRNSRETTPLSGMETMEKFPIEAERSPLPTFRRGETASPIGEIIDGRPFRRYPLSRIFSLDLDDIKIGARYPRIIRINFLDVDDAQRLYSVSATGARKFEHACHTQRYEIGREAECVGQLADGDERNDRTAEIIRRNQFLPRTVRKPIRSR